MSELKHQILGRKKGLEHIPATELPELGVELWLKRMSGDEHDRYHTAQLEASRLAEEQGESAYHVLSYLLLSIVVCDKDGNRIFDNADEIKAMDAVVRERLCLRASDLNGLTQAARDAIEKKLKLSSTGSTSAGSSANPTSGSSSGS